MAYIISTIEHLNHVLYHNDYGTITKYRYNEYTNEIWIPYNQEILESLYNLGYIEGVYKNEIKLRLFVPTTRSLDAYNSINNLVEMVVIVYNIPAYITKGFEKAEFYNSPEEWWTSKFADLDHVVNNPQEYGYAYSTYDGVEVVVNENSYMCNRGVFIYGGVPMSYSILFTRRDKYVRLSTNNHISFYHTFLIKNQRLYNKYNNYYHRNIV